MAEHIVPSAAIAIQTILMKKFSIKDTLFNQGVSKFKGFEPLRDQVTPKHQNMIVDKSKYICNKFILNIRKYSLFLYNLEPDEGFEPPWDFSAALQVRCYQPLSESGNLVPALGLEPRNSGS